MLSPLKRITSEYKTVPLHDVSDAIMFTQMANYAIECVS